MIFSGVWLLGTRGKWVYRRSLGGDLCLGIGIIFANFQIWGMIFLLRDRFSIFVR